ncbi:hypothetical protein L1987_43238 [Smallanthus sonchifolius]|uniref:Uncharacterized protein n=1 Tax=Smallanthus sonchifolius TaxID=185202 RepID=A0ACB9GL34_9ASTR|nr:hypothetical protein L1987_43238 [Smallanthus sonchifolius]
MGTIGLRSRVFTFDEKEIVGDGGGGGEKERVGGGGSGVGVSWMGAGGGGMVGTMEMVVLWRRFENELITAEIVTEVGDRKSHSSGAFKR